MAAQRLDRVLHAYRIGDPDGLYPIFDAGGSKLFHGRWHSVGTAILYASEHYSTAMLEKLVHGSGRLPPNQHFITITIPNHTSYEVVTPDRLPGWDAMSGAQSRSFGDRWFEEQRSAILIVPSVVARMERNILINPDHPDAGSITHDLHTPVWWDRRLFDRQGG